MIDPKNDYTRALKLSHLITGSERMLLLLLLLAAFSLRVYGINWDDGHMFHPDERHILMVTQRLALPDPLTLSTIADAKSPMNPQSFAYGSLSFYLLAIMTQLFVKISPLIQWLVGHPIQPSLEDMRIIGRAISAIFDTGTVFLTYVLGKRLYDKRIGMLGAAFVAFSVIDIQLSHFYASDTLLTFFIVLSALAAHNLIKRVGVKECALAGAAIGLALATKVSAAPIWITVVAAHCLRLFSRPGCEKAPYELQTRWPTRRELADTILYLEISVISAAIVFVGIQPYFVFDFATFVRNVMEQNDMVRGIADLPYTRQYINTTPYLYQLQNLVVWGLGFPLGIVALLGSGYVLVRGFVHPRRQDLLLLSWTVVYFLIVGSFHTKFMRYLLPIAPFVSIFGAVMLVDLWDRFKARSKTHSLGISKSPIWSATIGAIALGTVVLTFLYAITFAAVYSAPHTAVEASKWIYKNVPPGSSIAVEHWEEGMPVSINEGGIVLSPGSQQYRINVLELYEPDSEAKQAHIVDRLLNSDYIVFFSNRLYGTIPRLPDRYPMTTKYYQLLFGEQLGFKLQAAFTSYPRFLNLIIMDDTFAEPRLPAPFLLRSFAPSAWVLNLGKADESFSVYDHPKVLVFGKTERLSAEELRSRLDLVIQARPKTGLVLNEEQFLAMTKGGTFAKLFDRAGIENHFPLVVWIVLVQLLGLAAVPIAFKALSNLPDRGYGVSKALGILLLGWLTWIVASVGLLPNDRATVFLMLALVIFIGIGTLYWQRQSVFEFLRDHRKLIITSELIFWSAFALFLIIRMANPDLWHPYRGGEKPMDLAYLMAVIKSVRFPPYDPWFAGGYMNYYYFGHVLVATLIKLSGIVPTTAYNLAVPLLFAQTAGGVFSATHALAGKLRDIKLDLQALFAGLGAILFALILGNLGGAIQIVDQIRKIDASINVQALPGPSTSLANTLWAIITGTKALDIPSDWYWASTRVIQGTINEFPFFTFLYADLHAHMIALPFTMLTLAFAVHFVKGGGQKYDDRQGRSDVWAKGFAALALGALYVTNSWDYPTYVVIIAAAMLIPWYRLWYKDRTLNLRILLRRLLSVLLVVGLSILFYLPFHSNFQSFYSGVDPSPEKSDIQGYVVIHGLFLFVIVSFLVAEIFKQYKDAALFRIIRLVLKSGGRGERFVRLFRRLVKRTDRRWVNSGYQVTASLVFILLLYWARLQVVALLLGLFIIALLVIAGRERSVEDTFALFLIILGIVLGIAVEFFAIKGDIGRMNTVFKFYLQVWMLWSVGTALVVRSFIRGLWAMKLAPAKYFWTAIFILILSAAAIYPVVATKARVLDRFDNSHTFTLDGTAYMNSAVYHDQNGDINLSSDQKAIRWIQDNIVGSPVILEGRSPLYRWGSRISIYTGLPTVLGWDWHQKQQRWGYQWMVDKRANDVTAMYSVPSIENTLALLREYKVSYVYVGELERVYYPRFGLEKFDAMVGSYLDIVYDEAGVKIYKVRG